MAIAFARCEYKSRSTGGNAVRSAAYNCRSPMVDERTGERFDFRRHRKSGDIHLGVRVPEGAPAEFCNPVHLWNAAEVAEKRKDAQVAREIVLALPKEGSAEDWVALLERFASKHFVAKGVAVQLDIHEPDEETANPHAHILITTRRLTPAGFETVKARDLDPEVISTKRGGRQVDGERWGEIWRAEQDEYFREQGLELRVDPTQAKPEKHLGPKRFRAPEDCGPKQDAAETEVENAAAWRDPGQVLEIMTRRSPTFRLGDLDRQLARRIADPEERAAVRGGVLGHRDLVEVYDPQSGARARRYTTRQVIAEENQARRDAAGLVADLRHAVRPAAVGAALGRRPTMREDQRSALHHAVGPEGLAIVQGRAGTGKSYTLSAVAEVYAASGCEVIGLGPTNAIGRELAADPHIQRGGTLHSELWFVENGKRRWNDKTVVLVDEAGMVDTKTMGRLMSAARSARAKVILVGDDRQLQSVALGGLFRELAAGFGGWAGAGGVDRVRAAGGDPLERHPGGEYPGAGCAVGGRQPEEPSEHALCAGLHQRRRSRAERTAAGGSCRAQRDWGRRRIGQRGRVASLRRSGPSADRSHRQGTWAVQRRGRDDRTHRGRHADRSARSRQAGELEQRRV